MYYCPPVRPSSTGVAALRPSRTIRPAIEVPVAAGLISLRSTRFTSFRSSTMLSSALKSACSSARCCASTRPLSPNTAHFPSPPTSPRDRNSLQTPRRLSPGYAHHAQPGGCVCTRAVVTLRAIVQEPPGSRLRTFQCAAGRRQNAVNVRSVKRAPYSIYVSRWSITRSKDGRVGLSGACRINKGHHHPNCCQDHDHRSNEASHNALQSVSSARTRTNGPLKRPLTERLPSHI
jgi:hypothetical protein